MKNVKFLFCTFVALSFANFVIAQSHESTCRKAAVVPYSNCTAILLDNKMLVDEFTADGQCAVFPEMTGDLTISTVDFSFGDFGLTLPVLFKVAIKNEQSNTLWMYSEASFIKLRLEDVLKKCQLGDRIILITVDQEYALPHHEIVVKSGC